METRDAWRKWADLATAKPSPMYPGFAPGAAPKACNLRALDHWENQILIYEEIESLCSHGHNLTDCGPLLDQAYWLDKLVWQAWAEGLRLRRKEAALYLLKLRRQRNDWGAPQTCKLALKGTKGSAILIDAADSYDLARKIRRLRSSYPIGLEFLRRWRSHSQAA